jgi:nucleotide-binding universal stress UspA family protein
MPHRETAAMFKHILVPTDGSKLSEKALKHACTSQNRATQK